MYTKLEEIKTLLAPYLVDKKLKENVEEETFYYPYGNKVLTTWQELKSIFSTTNLNARAYATSKLVNNGGLWIDIGPGPGGITSHIADKVEYIAAVDIDLDHLKAAKIFSGKPNIDFVYANIFDLHLPDNSFNGVLFTEVIEHVDVPVKYLKEIYRILKPGGYLIISTPNAQYYRELISRLFYFSRRQLIKRLLRRQKRNNYHISTNTGHIYSWTFETLFCLVAREKFSLEDLIFCSYGLPQIKIGKLKFGGGDANWLKLFLGPFCSNILMRFIKE